MKKCYTCKEKKDESEFGKDKSKEDGRFYKCKTCRKIYIKIRYQENKEKFLARQKIHYQTHKEEIKAYYQENKDELKAYNKIYMQTAKGKEGHRKSSKKWIKNNPEKKKAHNILNNAIKYGKIIKPTICSICGKENGMLHGHHNSYEKGDELKVIWCCKECHILLDKKLTNNKETK